MVVLLIIGWDRWFHACARHPEIDELLLDVVLTVENPTYREPDPMPGRERLFRQADSGAWIRVVLEFDGDFDRFVTAFLQGADPTRGWPR